MHHCLQVGIRLEGQGGLRSSRLPLGGGQAGQVGRETPGGSHRLRGVTQPQGPSPEHSRAAAGTSPCFPGLTGSGGGTMGGHRWARGCSCLTKGGACRNSKAERPWQNQNGPSPGCHEGWCGVILQSRRCPGGRSPALAEAAQTGLPCRLSSCFVSLLQTSAGGRQIHRFLQKRARRTRSRIALVLAP